MVTRIGLAIKYICDLLIASGSIMFCLLFWRIIPIDTPIHRLALGLLELLVGLQFLARFIVMHKKGGD